MSTHDDRSLILNVSSWPRWPYLPMKRRAKTTGEWPDLAVLFDRHPPDRSGALMFPVTLHIEYIAGRPVQQQSKSYDDVEAILADGWIVD